MNIKCFISLKVSTFTSDHLYISIRGLQLLVKLDNLLIVLFIFVIVFILTFLIVSSTGRNQSQISGREENNTISISNLPG